MKKYITLIVILSAIYLSFSQNGGTSKNTANEKIYVHINTTFIMSGETLYYNVYCVNEQSKKLSNLSKIAYIEIINDNKEPVLKQKLKLSNGVGYSDFFIPSTLPSGNYKFIAYTSLMRNTNSFFSNDLVLINPFQEDQSKVIDTTNAGTISKGRTKQDLSLNSDSPFLAISFDKIKVKPREKIALIIATLLNNASYGNYSLPVKKQYPIDQPERTTSLNFSSFSSVNELQSNHFFIPEFRGELISGKVINKKTNTALANVMVALSIAEKEPIFKISGTNQEGAFYFNLDQDYENTTGTIQIIGDNTDNLELILPERRAVDYGQFSFSKRYFIDENHKEIILKKSINNQIENSFREVKQDSIEVNKSKTLFFGATAKDYYLDEYKRFSTLRETFVEVIENAWIGKKDGKSFIAIKKKPDQIDYKLPILLLVDGILIQNHDDIIDIDPREIHKISVIRDLYSYGPHLFEGIVAIETIEGDFKAGPNVQTIQLFKPTQRKKYFSPSYTNETKNERIPDYRDQLLWKPNFRIDSRETHLEFYSSDEKGIFEINLEGFTDKGDAVSIKKYLEVH